MVPWLLSLHPNGMHLDRFSRFCGADACDPATDRQTDRPRYTHSSYRPHPMLRSVMRPLQHLAGLYDLLTSDVSYAHFMLYGY